MSPGEENDRPPVAVHDEVLLQIQTACAGHADVEDQATGAIFKIGVQ
jgi:hypothetical protein